MLAIRVLCHCLFFFRYLNERGGCAGGGSRFGDGDLVRKIPKEPFNKTFAEAKKAATAFVLQRVVPLSQLNFVDDEFADILDESRVKRAIKVRWGASGTACASMWVRAETRGSLVRVTTTTPDGRAGPGACVCVLRRHAEWKREAVVRPISLSCS